MPFDIQKDNQIFGPHTREDLEAFIARGEISINDTIIQESGERMSVEAFLNDAKPLRLKLAVPAQTTQPQRPVPPPIPFISSRPPTLSYDRAPATFIKRTDKAVGGTIYRLAGSYAIIAIVLGVVVGGSLPFVKFISDITVKRLLIIGVGFLIMSAVPAGIVALCGIRSHGTRKLLWKGMVGILVPVLFLCISFVKPKQSRATAQIDLVIPMMATEINKAGPRMLDEHTRLDGATVEPGRRLVMNFTTVSMKAAHIDRALWNKEFVPVIKNTMVKSKHASLLSDGLVLVYRYSGSDGVFFDDIIVDASSLRKK